MIIRETPEHFICYTQPDHARLSADIASAWRKELLPQERQANAMHAIEHHDDAWIIPDAQPVWNDAANAPHHFITYPMQLKLHFYKQGLNSIQDPYAQLLCSMHFSSFYANNNGETERSFFIDEKLRQQQLLAALDLQADDPALIYHFYLLQFCDDLSLFICMHAPMEKEQSFQRSAALLRTDATIHAQWRSENELTLQRSPLQQPLNCLLRYKRIDKKSCEAIGIDKTWNETHWAHWTFVIS